MAISFLRLLGDKGENLAVKHLKKQGYKILHRNFKCKLGEVDIIAQLGDTVCFIEVKTRSTDYFGAPCEAVTPERQRRYKNCAKFYYANRQIDYNVRFDIIEVFNGKINHIENAF
ncbi:MAG: YraN family protein [Clostridiales bacterium]|nr:YraN family protein [Clostridiales bacterium]